MPPKLVLLDRDGVLNEDRTDSVRHPAALVMLPRAAAAVARLNSAGIRVAVCTNQSIVGRGIIDPAMLALIHRKLDDELAAAGAHLDDLLVAPDAPDTAPPEATTRRKPGPAMLLEALSAAAADPATTPMIGDALRDLEAATAAGCLRHLVRTGKGQQTEADGLPDHVAPVRIHDDLWDAVDWILGHTSAIREAS